MPDVESLVTDQDKSKLFADIFDRKPLLGFNDYAPKLGELIRGADRPRLTVGIFGGYGSGKTTLMRAIQKHLNEKQPKKPNEDGGPPLITVWFDAWRYDHVPHLFVPLLWTIGAHPELAGKKGMKATISQGIRAFVRGLKVSAPFVSVDFDRGFKAAKEMSRAESSDLVKVTQSFVDVRSCLERLTLRDIGEPPAAEPLRPLLLNHLARLLDKTAGAIEWVWFAAADLLWRVAPARSGQAQQQESDPTERLKRRIAIFIDDLDRCLPAKAFRLLEQTKALTDIEGFIFVIGLDRRAIKAYVKSKYKDLRVTAEEYIQKMFQVACQVPEPSEGQLKDLIVERFKSRVEPDVAAVLDRLAELDLMPPTVRQIKRLLNAVMTIRSTAPKEPALDPVLLLDLLVVREQWPKVYDHLCKSRHESLSWLLRPPTRRSPSLAGAEPCQETEEDGARTPEEHMTELGLDKTVAEELDSGGFKSFVAGVLEEHLSALDITEDIAFYLRLIGGPKDAEGGENEAASSNGRQ